MRSKPIANLFAHTVDVMTAAAPPPAAVLEAIERQGFRITTFMV